MNKYVKRKINDIVCWIRLGEQQVDLLVEKGKKLEVDKYQLPIFGSIELTGKCNLKCIHCYAVTERDKPVMSTGEIKKIINGLAKTGCLFLHLTGGECTLRNDFSAIYKHAYNKGIILTISTNGTLINDKIIALFKECPPYRIFVSLYGSNNIIHEKITDVKGSFNKTIDGLKKMKAANLNVFVNCLAMKDNIEDMAEIKKITKSLGVQSFFYSRIVRILNYDKTPYKLKAKKDLLNKYLPKNITRNKFLGINRKNNGKCLAGFNSFHIDCEGFLMPCKMVRRVKFKIDNGDIKTSWGKLTNSQSLLKQAIIKDCVIDGCEL